MKPNLYLGPRFLRKARVILMLRVINTSRHSKRCEAVFTPTLFVWVFDVKKTVNTTRTPNFLRRKLTCLKLGF